MRYQFLPDLDPEDYYRLRDDIAAHGVLCAVLVDEDGNIIDGHHRWRICEELGIDCPTQLVAGLSEAEKRHMAYAVNVLRRHLTLRKRLELVRAWLNEHPEDSNRAIASGTLADRKTVAAIRRELEADGDIPHVRHPSTRRSMEAGATVERDRFAEEEDAAEPLDPDRADLKHLVWFELTIGYPGPPDDSAPPREGPVRRQWYSRRLYVNQPPPTNDVEARALMMEIASVAQRLIVTRRRLRTMGS